MSLRGKFSSSYGDEFNAIFDVSFNRGTATVIVGPSGGGKTTLLRTIGLAKEPDSGVVTIDDQVVFDSSQRLDYREQLWKRVSLVFQEFCLWPHLTAEQNIRLPLELTKRDQQHIGQLFEQFEISEFRSRYPYQLGSS